MDKALRDKLKIKDEHSILILNVPDGYTSKFGKADVTPRNAAKYDLVLLFAKSKTHLEKSVLKSIKALKSNGLFWIAYPKKTSGIKTDLSRDYGWDTLTKLGFEGISLISIDDTWSSLRLRRWEKSPSKKLTEEKSIKQFTAVLETPGEGMDATYVSIPFDVEKIYGAKGNIKVKAWFDGHPYRGILANMGTGSHAIIVRKDIRHTIGKNPGDKIKVELEKDVEERIVEVPDDLKKALDKSRKASEFFNTLSYTNRKEYSGWISSAKKEETRKKRLSTAIEKLLKGKKNPSAK